MANSSATRLGYIPEVTPGTTPALALQLVRFTSITPRLAQGFVQSEEIVNSRELQDHIPISRGGGLSVGVEYSYGAYHGILEALLGGTWSANVLQVGSTKRTQTWEAQYTDMTPAQYAAFRFGVVTKFALAIAKGQVQRGSFDVVSRFPVWGTATVGTGAASAAPSNPVLNPNANVVLIQEGGAGSLSCTEFSMELLHEAILNENLGSDQFTEMENGDILARGSFSQYFKDRTVLDKFVNATDTSLQLQIGGATTLRDDFLFGSVKLTTPPDLPTGRRGQPIIVRFGWEAKYNATSSTIRITRNP
ncbi:MAG TPA: phage tail tube protein [Gemmatimonadaceae bacterium]|nr:phage tail tube protein [Gemmatimonadaceae bacterium]